MGCMGWLNKMQKKEQGGRAAASVSLLPACPSCLRLLLPCLSPVMDSTLNQGARYVLPSVVLAGYPSLPQERELTEPPYMLPALYSPANYSLLCLPED